MKTRDSAVTGVFHFLGIGLLLNLLLHAQIGSPVMSWRDSVSTDRFATSELCSRCHCTGASAKAFKDAQGRSTFGGQA